MATALHEKCKSSAKTDDTVKVAFVM